MLQGVDPFYSLNGRVMNGVSTSHMSPRIPQTDTMSGLTLGGEAVAVEDDDGGDTEV